MSVIVKGMEMPTNCSDCPLNYDQMSCIVTGTRWWSDTMVLINFDSDKERLHDCPLIPVEIEIYPPVQRVETLLPTQMQQGRTSSDERSGKDGTQRLLQVHAGAVR